MTENDKYSFSKLYNIFKDNVVNLVPYEVLNKETNKIETRWLLTIKSLSEEDLKYIKRILTL